MQDRRYIAGILATLFSGIVVFAAGNEPSKLRPVAMVNMGRLEESYPLFRTIFRQDKNWRILLPRLVPSGLIGQQAVDEILKKVK